MLFRKPKKTVESPKRRLEDRLRAEETVIAGGTTRKGTLRSTNGMIIDGAIEGDIFSTGIFFLAENGQILGNVDAAGVIVEGRIQGNIVSGGSVEVRTTGRVVGDIDCDRIAFEEGCSIRGKIRMPQKNAGPVRFQEKREREEIPPEE
jgi:cytoskeletal protein CcmA (bactofilin family)